MTSTLPRLRPYDHGVVHVVEEVQTSNVHLRVRPSPPARQELACDAFPWPSAFHEQRLFLTKRRHHSKPDPRLDPIRPTATSGVASVSSTFANDLERTHYGGVAKTAERYVHSALRVGFSDISHFNRLFVGEVERLSSGEGTAVVGQPLDGVVSSRLTASTGA